MIQENWLSDLSLQVSKLEIDESSVVSIMVNAFNTDVFKTSLTSLIIDNNLNDANDPLVLNLHSRFSFQGLASLSTFVITNVPTLVIQDPLFFSPLAETLINIQISRISNPWSPSDLFLRVQLDKIKIVNLSWNHFKRINSSDFAGFAKTVDRLALTNSKIEEIVPNTFDGFKALQLLSLQSNLLSTIPALVFEKLIINQTFFNVTLHNNKWDCTCDLAFLKEIVLNHSPNYIRDPVTCASPDELAGMKITDIDFCVEPETTIDINKTSTVCLEEDEDEEDCITQSTHSELTTTDTLTTTTDPPTTTTTTNPPTVPPTNPPTNPPTVPPTDPPTVPLTDPPTTTEPTTTEPTTTEPTTTEPTTTKPTTTEPTTTELTTTEPTTTEPTTTEPTTTEPTTTEPTTTKPTTPEPTTNPPTDPATDAPVTEAPTTVSTPTDTTSPTTSKGFFFIFLIYFFYSFLTFFDHQTLTPQYQ